MNLTESKMNPERVALIHAAVMGVETRHLGGRRNGMWQIKTIDAWNDAPPFDERLVFGVWLPRLQADGWTIQVGSTPDGHWSALVERVRAHPDTSFSQHAHLAAAEAIALAKGVEDA